MRTKPVLIPADEQVLIELLLSLPDESQRKRGLQQLCMNYECGRVLKNNYKVSQLLIALLQDVSIQVRRWAYKSIALLNNTTMHLGPLVNKVTIGEADPENHTWAIAALFKIAHEDHIEDLIGKKKIGIDGAGILAAHLYPEKRYRILENVDSVNPETSEPLTLRWASLLFGYQKIKENLFDPKFENKVVIPALNGHDDASVSEYSVWALHQHPERGIDDLGFPVDVLSNKPPNVRRWVNRLLTKDEATVTDNLDLIEEMSKDQDARSREGLAIGLQPVWTNDVEGRMVGWLSREQEESVQHALLEHMARHASKCTAYHDVVVEWYKDARHHDVLCQRLQSASVGTPLHTELKRLEYGNDRHQDLFDQSQMILLGATIDMSSNQNFNSGGGPISIGANVGEGSLFVNAEHLVKQASQHEPILSEILQEALNALKSPHIDEGPRQAAVDAIAEAAKTPGPSTLSNVADHLSNVSKLVTAGSGIAENLAPVVDKIKDYFNGI